MTHQVLLHHPHRLTSKTPARCWHPACRRPPQHTHSARQLVPARMQMDAVRTRSTLEMDLIALRTWQMGLGTVILLTAAPRTAATAPLRQEPPRYTSACS